MTGASRLARRACASAIAALAFLGCAGRAPRVSEPFAFELFDDLPGDGALGRSRDGRSRFEAAWAALEARDLRGASEGFRALVSSPPLGLPASELYPALAGLAVVRLVSGEPAAALTGFDQALAMRPDYHQGRLGRAAALHQLGDDQGAFDELEAIRGKADPASADRLRARVEPRLLARWLEQAKVAEERDDPRTALAALERAAALDPSSQSLQVRLGDRAAIVGALERSVQAYQAAVALEAADVETWLKLGDGLVRLGRYEEARQAFEQAAALPGGMERARERVLELREEQRGRVGARPEVEASRHAPVMDRAGLAALLIAELPVLQRAPRSSQPRVVIDVHGSWARNEIQEVVALGLMEVYDNHTFRPDAPVNRATLARSAAAVLRLFRQAGRIVERPAPQVLPVDVPAEHLFFRDIVEVIRYEVLDLPGSAEFRPQDPVSGEEAWAAIGRLAVVAG